MHSLLSSCKNLPRYFFMVHLLHRLYGVDAPVNVINRPYLLLLLRSWYSVERINCEPSVSDSLFVFVCQCVREYIFGTTRPIFTKFLCVVVRRITSLPCCIGYTLCPRVDESIVQRVPGNNL